jgi:spore coat protein U-like protein
MKRLLLPLICLFVLFMAPEPASALDTVCTFSKEGGFDFGTLDPLTSRNHYDDMKIQVHCATTVVIDFFGLLAPKIHVCMSLDQGTAYTGSVRHMTGPNGTKIGYQFYSDATRTAAYRVGTKIPNNVGVPWSFAKIWERTNGVSSFSVHGVITDKASAEDGVYTDTVTANFQYVEYLALFGPPANCFGPVVSIPLQVRVLVKPFCALEVSEHIDFGSWQDLNEPRDQEGKVAVTCDKGTTYAVKLGWGGQGEVNKTRNMANGSEKIAYNLFQDANRTQLWGDDASTGFLKDQKSDGTAKKVPIYARVPKQATPSPGTYTDNVVVTLQYN